MSDASLRRFDLIKTDILQYYLMAQMKDGKRNYSYIALWMMIVFNVVNVLLVAFVTQQQYNGYYGYYTNLIAYVVYVIVQLLPSLILLVANAPNLLIFKRNEKLYTGVSNFHGNKRFTRNSFYLIFSYIIIIIIMILMLVNSSTDKRCDKFYSSTNNTCMQQPINFYNTYTNIIIYITLFTLYSSISTISNYFVNK